MNLLFFRSVRSKRYHEQWLRSWCRCIFSLFASERLWILCVTSTFQAIRFKCSLHAQNYLTIARMILQVRFPARDQRSIPSSGFWRGRRFVLPRWRIQHGSIRSRSSSSIRDYRLHRRSSCTGKTEGMNFYWKTDHDRKISIMFFPATIFQLEFWKKTKVFSERGFGSGRRRRHQSVVGRDSRCWDEQIVC